MIFHCRLSARILGLCSELVKLVTCVHMRLASCSHLCSDSTWAGGNHNSVHLDYSVKRCSDGLHFMAHLAYGWQENAKRQEFFPHLLIWPHFRHRRNSIPQNSSQSTNRNTEEVIPRFGAPTTPNCKHDSRQKLGEQPKEAAKKSRRKEKRKERKTTKQSNLL